MPPQHRAVGQALGARGADIVLVHHLDERRAGDARQDRRLGQGKRDRRQQQCLQRRPCAGAPAGKAAGRHQPEPDREEVDEHQREPEVRDGDAELRRSHGYGIAGPALSARRKQADRDGDGGGKRKRHQRQRQRYDQPLAHQIDDGYGVGVGAAEIQCHQTADPMQVAQDEGGIEPHLVAQQRDLVGAGVHAEHQPGRITRQHLQNGKHHHRSHHQGDGRDDKALQEVGGHGWWRPVRPTDVIGMLRSVTPPSVLPDISPARGEISIFIVIANL